MATNSLAVNGPQAARQRGAIRAVSIEKHPGSGEWWICYWDAQRDARRREKAGTEEQCDLTSIGSARTRHSKERSCLRSSVGPPLPLLASLKMRWSIQRLTSAATGIDKYRMKQLSRLVWLSRCRIDHAPRYRTGARRRRRVKQLAPRNREPAPLPSLYDLSASRFPFETEKCGRIRLGMSHADGKTTSARDFLEREEETALRAKIRVLYPAREPEFDMALHTGMRRNEQWQLRWQDVNLRAGMITIPQSEHGAARPRPYQFCGTKGSPNCGKESQRLPIRVCRFQMSGKAAIGSVGLRNAWARLRSLISAGTI